MGINVDERFAVAFHHAHALEVSHHVLLVVQQLIIEKNATPVLFLEVIRSIACGALSGLKKPKAGSGELGIMDGRCGMKICPRGQLSGKL